MNSSFPLLSTFGVAITLALGTASAHASPACTHSGRFNRCPA